MSLVDTNTGEIVARSLEENEAIIERGLATFIEVGNALAEIRDNRLYRESHGTFEGYCRDRWGWNRNYANKVISAADVGTNVPIDNEGQARALTPLTDDPAEWNKVHDDPVMWQNVRNSEAFSDDGGATFYLVGENPKVIYVSAHADTDTDAGEA